MPSLIEAESTLTDRYQTTVPETVRRALQLGKRDRIRWAINADGQVLLQRADDAADPVLGRFLDFLAADMTAHPEHLRSLDTELATHLEKLVGHIDIDLGAPLSDDGE
ncbi:MAG: type II toxin-antitoxin system PrlF family antitoxin [Lysobacteraceae bacterium]